MKTPNTFINSLIAIAVGILILGFIVFLITPRHNPRLDNQIEREASLSLQPACDYLDMAISDKPDGGSCVSMEEAVNYVTVQRGGDSSIWRCSASLGTNCVIYLNPNWSTWRAVSTNGDGKLSEIAAFCGPTLVSNKANYFGLTFDRKIIPLVIPPAWPAAISWLKEANLYVPTNAAAPAK